MLNYYEETMPLVTDEDEYKKYLIDESLPLFDKLNIIIKKGFPIQRQALLSSLNIYIDNSLFKPLLQFIIEEIQTWDTETLLLLPKSLHNILINCLPSINNELFNIIFKHIIISISSGNEKLSKEYIFYFDMIIENYTKKFNNGENFPYKIGDDIFEIIFSLGKFGQSPENIRLCCYLSSCMCRLVGHVRDNENIQKMFNRICLLFGDLENTTERQISRELRYLIPIFKEKILEKNDIIKAIKSYINHDWDHAIQATTIVSLIVNFKYISKEIKELIYDKIKEIFEEINYEEEHKNNLLDTLIDMLYNQCIEYDKKDNINKDNNNNCADCELNDLINKSLQLSFMDKFLFKDKIEPLLIINFDKIYIILKHSSLYNYNGNNNMNQAINFLHYLNCEEGMAIDNIFFRIFSKIFPKCCNNNSNNSNNLSDSNSSPECNNIEKLKKLLILNFYKMIPCLNYLKYTKYLCEKITNLFKKENILFVLKVYEDEFTLNNFSKKNNYLYKLLFCLLEKGYSNINIINSNNNGKHLSLSTNTSCSSNNNSNSSTVLLNENNYHFKLFQNILENIFSFYNSYPELLTCQIHFLLAKTFQKIIKKIYKYYKPYSPNNKEKIGIDKLYDDLFNEYLVHVLKDDEIGNHIKIEYINVFPYLILYGKNRQNYYNFIEDEILKSNQFYTRRCSINFIEKCLKVYSFRLFLKFNFLEIIHYLINDENNIISASIIEKIFVFYKKIKLFSKESLDKICSLLSEINIRNKDSNSVKNFDIEKNRTIKKILNLNNNSSQENNKNKYFNNYPQEKDEKEEKEITEIKANEEQKISKENEILGKNYQNIVLLITVNSNKNNTNNADKKHEIEIKNEKHKYSDDQTQLNITQKARMNKQHKLLTEKSISGVLQNINSKNNSKKFLPKLRHNGRKHSCTNSRPFDINFFYNKEINIIGKMNNKTLNLNKLIIGIKDKTPEKKNFLKSINQRLPSANSSKARDSFSSNPNNNSGYRDRHIFLSQNKNDNNILIDELNYQIINFNGINKSSIINNIIGYNKDIFKELINHEQNINNNYKENKLAHSSKNISHLKNGIKGLKLKKDSYFNVSNKITINAKVNEINKSNK